MVIGFFVCDRRFYYSLIDYRRWIRERSYEFYVKNYFVVFFYDESLVGRNMRRDFLYEVRFRRYLFRAVEFVRGEVSVSG